MYPGESIQAAVNANPEGTTFTIMAGVHRLAAVSPKAGNTFIGEPGAVLDGGNSVKRAFVSGKPNVTIRGLEIRNYATDVRDRDR